MTRSTSRADMFANEAPLRLRVSEEFRLALFGLRCATSQCWIDFFEDRKMVRAYYVFRRTEIPIHLH